MWWTAVFEEQWTASLPPPSSSTPWERALDAVDGDLAARDPVGLITAARSAKDVPLVWLPYLAADRSVDEFTSTWPEERQRAVVAGSFDFHKVKGARLSLDRALEPLGYTLSVTEWFEVEPYRDRYTFRIRVTIGDLEPWLISDRDTLTRVANGAKNLRSKLEAIEQVRNIRPANVYVGGVVVRRRKLTVGPVPRPSNINIKGHVFVGAAQVRRRTLIIPPRG